MSRNASQDRVIDEAAQWLSLLDSGHASPEEYQAFAEWQASDPRHAQIISLLQGNLGKLHGSGLRQLSDERLIQAINAPSSRRRFLQKGIGLLSLAGAAILIGRFDRSGFVWPGDLTTGTAERRHILLPDGSELTLNARSRVSPEFNDRTRLLRARSGEFQLKVRADSPIPFQIVTPQGLANTLDATLQIRQGPQETRLLVSAASVDLHTLDGERRLIQAGQSAYFDGHGLLRQERASDDASTWLTGLLKVHDQPLGQVIDSLRPYRKGIIHISPAASRLRVSGIYPLDDSDQALQVLQESLELKVEYLTPYWVSIDIA